MKHKPIIGVTGGIGAGKSTVARCLSWQGAAVIDMDALGHQQLAETDVQDAIRREFGDDVFLTDGGVNRSALGQRVFSDSDQRRRLEAIVHPRMLKQCRERVDTYQADPRFSAIVIDAGLLSEMGADVLCDIVIFVDAKPEKRFARCRRKHGWDRSEWALREKSQWPLDNKREKAHNTLSNHGCESDLTVRVKNLFPEILNSFGEQG